MHTTTIQINPAEAATIRQRIAAARQQGHFIQPKETQRKEGRMFFTVNYGEELSEKEVKQMLVPSAFPYMKLDTMPLNQMRMLIMDHMGGAMPSVNETGTMWVSAFTWQAKRYHFTGNSEREVLIALLNAVYYRHRLNEINSTLTPN